MSPGSSSMGFRWRRLGISGAFWSALGGWLLLSFFTFLINVAIGETGVEIVHFRRVVRL